MLTQASYASAAADQPESRKRWLVVIGAMVWVAVGLSPVPFYTVGMFVPELSKAFGWPFF